MSYFVTGATGFIGRNLVEQLLEREGTIYVLVREGSHGRLEELRNRWGVDDERVVGIVGDLSQPGSVSPTTTSSACAASRPLLPPRRDLRHDRRRRVAEGRQHRRHPAHGRARRARSRPAASTWSARSPPPASTRAPGARTCSRRPQNLDIHPYFRTKHESEGVVRDECERPWRVYRPGIVVGNSETGEMDKVDGPYYFFKLIRRIRNSTSAAPFLAKPSS